MESNKENYMYVLVNDDLKMGKGKIAGQVGHVVGLITDRILRNFYNSNKSEADASDEYKRYVQWSKSGSAKIILKATEEQIRSFIGQPESAYILDLGRTQIAPNSLTVIGFYPNSNLKEKFKDFKLL